MGLLKHVLFWPVTGPLFLAEFSLEKVHGVVREELTDDTRIKAELLELQLKLELGDIDDDEYIAQEAQLMHELREVRRWREEFGMGVAGGPVRVRSEGAAPARQDETEGAVPAESAPGDADAASADRQPRVADAGAGADVELNLDWD
ncbi:MAG TPA: gas vesicle protein GvpG [Longimicrobiales bacterium]